ncbi:3'-5' RNA exonuclease complex component, partial [Tilletia horrida]
MSGYQQPPEQHQQQQGYYWHPAASASDAGVNGYSTNMQPTAITTEGDLTEEIDPNMVSPWGTYPQHQQSQSPPHQLQHQHHHHSHQHSAHYDAQGFHDVQLAAQQQQQQQQQQQPQQQQQQQQQQQANQSIDDDRAVLVQHPAAMPTMAHITRNPTNTSFASSTNHSIKLPFARPTHNLRSAQSSRTGSLDLDLETEKAILRQHRQSRMGPAGEGSGTGTGRAHDMNRELSDFDIANGRFGKRLLQNKAHIAQHGDQIPVSWGHLFKRPLVRQWLHNGKLYREEDEREPSRFELFFDLS